MARLALEGLLGEVPVLFAWRGNYQSRPRVRAQCEVCPTCQEWRELPLGHEGRAESQYQALRLACGHSLAEAVARSRPCVFVSCKAHVGLDVARRTGSLRINPSTTGETCALDVAEKGPHSQEEVAALLGWRMIDSVRQAERAAEAQMRVHGGEQLRATLRDYEPSPEGNLSSGPSGSLAEVAFGGESPEHLRTPEIAAREAEAIEQWSRQAADLVRGGVPLAVAWAVTNHLEAEAMATKTKKNKGPKLGGNGKASKGEPTTSFDGETPIGKAFTAKQPIPIDPARRERVSEELVEVLGEIDEVNEERSAEIGKFNSRLKDLRKKQRELAEAHRTSTEKVDTRCQLYLLPGNEVVTKRLDTGDVVERRTAKAEELQQGAFADQHTAPTKGPRSFLEDDENEEDGAA